MKILDLVYALLPLLLILVEFMGLNPVNIPVVIPIPNIGVSYGFIGLGIGVVLALTIMFLLRSFPLGPLMRKALLFVVGFFGGYIVQFNVVAGVAVGAVTVLSAILYSDGNF
jgi:hypothetical protein